MRRARGRAAVAALILCVLMPAVCADPPAVMEIATPGVFVSPARTPVRFTHADHQALDGVSCTTCHHVYKDGKNVLDPSTLTPGDPSLQCASCHAKPRDLENAYHELCITCHDAEKRKGGVSGPRTCGECHAWNR
jgi:hypothetical protein